MEKREEGIRHAFLPNGCHIRRKQSETEKEHAKITENDRMNRKKNGQSCCDA
jgi:hypothetical protein